MSIAFPALDGLSGMRHMKIIVCGALRTNTVTLSAFSSHQNTDKAFTPGGYTQLRWSSLSRGLELMRILSFRNCCVEFMITAWQIPDTASACIHKGSWMQWCEIYFVSFYTYLAWYSGYAPYFFQQKHFCEEQLLWLVFHKFALWYKVRWKSRLKFHGLLQWICLEYGMFQS